jgi:hypothetical protein
MLTPKGLALASTLAQGGLILKSTPPGAAVTVDGKSRGNTPCSLDDLSAGPHGVRLELAGYENVQFNTSIQPGEFTDLGVRKLDRSTGTLLVQSEPQDCSFVLLSGETEIRRGRTPEQIPNLPTGSYTVQLTKPGWPNQNVSANVTRQATEVVSHEFGVGFVEVTSDPPGAHVLLGEKVLGVTPLKAELPSGAHGPFQVGLPGYKLAEFCTRIVPGETARPTPLLLEAEPPSVEITTDPAGIAYKIYAAGGEPSHSTALRDGVTPATLVDLPPGHYRIIFQTAPWPEVAKSVEVAARGVTEINHDYPAGKVEVTSQPEGATVLLNKVAVGKTPYEATLPIGKYEVTTELKGRTAKARAVEIGEDDAETVRFDFTTNTATGTRSRRAKPPAKVSALTKFGRSIQNFFGGDSKDTKKKR